MKRGSTMTYPSRLALLLVVAGALVLGTSGCELFYRLFNEPPVAGFTVGPSTAGVAPFAVTVSAVTSSDPDGEIENYSWDFGDGGSATGASAAHTYAAAGTYTVVLTVTDKYEATAQASKTVYVTPAEPAGPTASFTASPTSGPSPLTVSFNAAASSYAAGAISAYEWDFGDGRTGYGTTATHTYMSSGSQSFTATLVVRGTDGKTGTATRAISISTSTGGGTTANAPSARFNILFDNPAIQTDSYTNTTVAPVRVWLDPADSRAASGRTIASYAWSFGDALAASALSPTVQVHTYFTDQTSKTFSVTLVVVDDVGTSNSVTKTVKVYNRQPVAGFEIYKTLGAATTPSTPDADWWRDKEDGLDDGRLLFTSVSPGLQTVSIRTRKIVTATWLNKNNTNPVPTTETGKPAEYSDSDGSNMCFDPEGQTWAGGVKPTWFPNRAWGIERLQVDWGDGVITVNVPFNDAADTMTSHAYVFPGSVKTWTITVTAYDFLGAHASFQRMITMNEGG